MYNALFFSDPTPTQALRLITRNKISLTVTMPAYYKQRIKQIPGVQAVHISQWYGGVYKDERDPANMFARFAVEPEDFFKTRQDLTLPEDQKQAFLRERIACIVGKKLADKLGFKLGDRITLKGDIFPGDKELVLRGIYNSPDDEESLFFNLEYLYQSLPAGRRDFAGTFGILAASKEDVPKIQTAVDAAFENSPVQTRTETEQAFALSFVSFLGNVKLFLFAICGAITFTILLVSANTMAMAVRERIKEVGVMKTLGFTQGGVLTIILGEAMTIALIGAVIGVLLAGILAAGIGVVAGNFVWQLRGLTLTLPTVAICLGFGAVVGLIAAILPAWTASRTPILETLRATG